MDLTSWFPTVATITLDVIHMGVSISTIYQVRQWGAWKLEAYDFNANEHVFHVV